MSDSITDSESISVISSHILRCSDEALKTIPESPFRLGPLDHLEPHFIPIPVIFIYEQIERSPKAELIPVERLQRALTRLLDYYPHLTGRLQLNPSDGTTEVTHLGTGAELTVACCGERLDAFSSAETSRIMMQSLPGAGNALLPPFDPSLESLGKAAVFTVQHTRFACGGVVLGIRVRHALCDAVGFFQLVSHLAELYRGLETSEASGVSTLNAPSLEHPPHIKSYMSELSGGNMSLEERLGALRYEPSLYYIQPTVDSRPAGTSSDVAPVPPSPPLAGRFLRFSSLELDALKARAKRPDSTLSAGNWTSAFDALSAHLYQCIYRARLRLRLGEDNSAAVNNLPSPGFLTPINLRARLDANTLPLRYFPNALFTACTSLPSDAVAHGPLWQIAEAIHGMTRTKALTSEDDIKCTLRWVAAQPDKQQIRRRIQLGGDTLMLSQWNKFDIYASAVFDKGVLPSLVSTPFTNVSLFDGLGYLFPAGPPGGRDPGAIDVNLALSELVWEILDQDAEFRDTVVRKSE